MYSPVIKDELYLDVYFPSIFKYRLTLATDINNSNLKASLDEPKINHYFENISNYIYNISDKYSAKTRSLFSCFIVFS